MKRVIMVLFLLLAVSSVFAQSETVTLREGDLSLTFKLPDGWKHTRVDFFGSFPAEALSTDEAMLSSDFLRASDPPTFEPGMVFMLVTMITDPRDMIGADSNEGAADVARIWDENIASALGETSIDSELNYNGQPAAMVTVEGESFAGSFVIVEAGKAPDDNDEQYAMIFLFTAPGERDQYQDPLTIVAESLQTLDNGAARFGPQPAPTEVTQAPLGDQHPLIALVNILPQPDDTGIRDADDSARLLSAIDYVDLEVLNSAEVRVISPYGSALQDLYEAHSTGLMVETVGFGWEEIDRVLAYGLPPMRTLILEGDFDTGAVHDALMAQGFESVSIGGAAGYCNPDGCDESAKIDLKRRARGNPFGGKLGRMEAIAVIERDGAKDMVIASPYYPMVENTVMHLMAGDLAGSSAVSAASALVAIAEQDGNPLVAAFIGDPLMFMGSASSVTLPAYSAIAYGSFREGPAAAVTLIYDDAADAGSAAAALPARLDESGESASSSYRELFTDKDISIGETTLLTLDQGAAVVLPFTMDSDRDDAYLLLSQMLIARNIGWLVP